MPTNAPPSPTPLPSTLDHLEHCPDCGYLLTGLQSGHRCPECGFAPEDGLVVLWGWAAGSRANVWTARPRGRAWKVIALAFLPIWLAVAIFTRQWLDLIIWGSIFLLPATYYWFQFRRGFNKPPRPVQLRMSPAGLGQRIGFGPVKLRPWDPNFKLEWQQKNAPKLLRIKCLTESSIGIPTANICDIETDLNESDQIEILARLTHWITYAGGQINRVL